MKKESNVYKLCTNDLKIIETISLLNEMDIYPLPEGVYKILKGDESEEIDPYRELSTYKTLVSYNSKKVSRLLQLINILKNDYSIELWIIGDGQDRNSYKTYIDNNKLNDNIKILGSKKNPYPYMKQADYIILTSDYEGFPVIYLESIVLNKKIITTIDVSDESIIINNNYGYIISKDINLMKNEVEDILKHDSLVYKQINFDELSKDKMKKLEKIFDEVK